MDTCTSIVFNREQTTEGNTKPNFQANVQGKYERTRCNVTVMVALKD